MAIPHRSRREETNKPESRLDCNASNVSWPHSGTPSHASTPPPEYAMPADVFDDQRRAWIAAHAGIFVFQKRRAELLGKRLRARTRARTGVRPDPHDDDVRPGILFRKAADTGWWEKTILATAAVAAPLGWPLGRLVYARITTLIPEKLRAYPIPAMVWAAVLSGTPLVFFYDPAPSIWSSLIIPWVLAQLPATFLAAGVYGVLEGWLAVDGSSHWWPMAPAAQEVDDLLFLGPMDLPVPTLLDPEPAKPEPPAVTHRRTPPKITWLPLVSGAILAALGALWFASTVIDGAFGSTFTTFVTIPDGSSTNGTTFR
ncbi:hypothetical protein L841_3121 [Mycobacterium sp. MAC_080597_8934]|uniref:hypothetical protein n=2 Tax=unclassified Mycobacterium avium complex (MAC) TaxID=2750822 RepID=UPI00045215DB|nr:hypothetical protein [Mycobacterium sp. MAC_011194_8550]ETZ66997.1 hypothetical protein L841_3125 [Mycobacterium sp. MAC_080597_8934]ETZ67023.1 hypothetical protein L841_3121 [Mycobacterium sp. MAC_080597_8934]